jgi:hypothetical protein
VTNINQVHYDSPSCNSPEGDIEDPLNIILNKYNLVRVALGSKMPISKVEELHRSIQKKLNSEEMNR